MTDHRKTFSVIILNGRPAAGKSEVIDYLKKIPVPERIERFHIGEFVEFDDFKYLWEDFEDDDLREQTGLARIVSDKQFSYQGETLPGYVFKEKAYWHFLIRKLSFQYAKFLRDNPDFHKNHGVALIEFSRGAEHGGFSSAYQHLSPLLLENAVTLYIHVDWPESLRKNRRRFNPNKPDSVLEHGLEDKKLEMLYKNSDWAEFAAHPDYLSANHYKIPYGVFNNMPEITDKPDLLGAHLQEVLAKTWRLYSLQRS